MGATQKLRSCYLRWTQYEDKGGQRRISDCDIDFSVKVDAFIEELQKAKELGLTDLNGWLNLRICENATPEGKGGYSHKLRIIM
jgi:hypothetical protein